MFGKGKRAMSANDKFVMAAGRAAGNIKALPKAPMKNTTAPKTVPAMKKKPLSPGKAGPMRLT